MAIAVQITETPVPSLSAALDEDEMIRLAAEGLLRSCNHGPVRDVRILVEDGVVMLFGTLGSFHLKQVVQTEVMKLDLVARVENHCRVESVPLR